MNVSISENRLKELLAAEACCQQLRIDICEAGGMTMRSVAMHDQWMRRSGSRKYKTPGPVHPRWCCQCRKRHRYGESCGN